MACSRQRSDPEAVINFFKLYIGDYQRDTGALALAEHGAYMLMLQHYYATEAPLPTGRDLHRLLRAETPSERKAIDAVAAKFWTITDAGLINERADEEIAKAQVQATKNREIALAREARKREAEAARRDQKSTTNRARTEHESCTTCEPNHSHSHSTTRDSVPDGTGGKPPPDPGEVDPTKAIFDLGVSILTAAGSKPPAARSLVGRLRKAVGDDRAMAVLVAAKATTDPAAYIGAAMKPDPVADEIRRKTGAEWVERLPDGRYRAGGRYYNADGSGRVALC